VTHSPWIKTPHSGEVCACHIDITHSPDLVQTFVVTVRQRVSRRKPWRKKQISTAPTLAGLNGELWTTLFGDLIFDRGNDPLIHVCDPLRFISITAFFADE
jgi:hypothetical protein